MDAPKNDDIQTGKAPKESQSDRFRIAESEWRVDLAEASAITEKSEIKSAD